MGLLNDVMKDDAKFAFLNTDEFGESVTFTPAGGSPRSIVAAIERAFPVVDSNGMAAVAIVLSVRNDATYGLTTTEARKTGTFAFKRHLADAATATFSQFDLMREDPGMLLIRIK